MYLIRNWPESFNHVSTPDNIMMFIILSVCWSKQTVCSAWFVTKNYTTKRKWTIAVLGYHGAMQSTDDSLSFHWNVADSLSKTIHGVSWSIHYAPIFSKNKQLLVQFVLLNISFINNKLQHHRSFLTKNFEEIGCFGEHVNLINKILRHKRVKFP